MRKKNMKLLQPQICEKKDKRSTSFLLQGTHGSIGHFSSVSKGLKSLQLETEIPPPKHPTTQSTPAGRNELVDHFPPAGGSEQQVRVEKKMVPTKNSVEFRPWNCLKTCESTMIGPKSFIHEHFNVNMDLSGLLPLSQAWDFANETGKVSCLVLMYLNGICSILYCVYLYIIHIYIYMLAPPPKPTFWSTPIRVNWQRTYRHKCIF